MSIQHVKIIGRVQGIGYRRWAETTAEKMHLSGWVRNASDGSVEIMVKGDQSTINEFLQACLKGPAFSMVLGIQPVTIPRTNTPPIQEGVFQIVASA